MIEEAGSVKVFKSEYHDMVSSQPKIFWKPVVEFSIMAEFFFIVDLVQEQIDQVQIFL